MSQKQLIVLLVLLIPVGLGTKYYHGPCERWVHGYAGDIFYPMFWYFLLRLLWKNLSPMFCAGSVLTFCVLVECSQLWTTPLLSTLRRTFPGALLLGSGFDWADIVYYVIGVAAAAGLERAVTGRPLNC